MTDKEYYRTMTIGAIIGASITILALFMLKPSPQTNPVTPESNFAVVDTYKGCEIVRWTDGLQAEYKYFLDCDNK